MNTLGIRELPLVEKFRLLEALWDDMRGRVETMTVPEEHHRLLEERRARARTAQTTLLDGMK